MTPVGAVAAGRPAPAPLRAASAFRLLTHAPAPGAWNMAVDEALLAAARGGGFTLRLYTFSPGCLSFGRHQLAAGRYDGGLAARLGIDVVRRPTGGRAVFHQREITYAVTAPAGAWGGVRESWRRIHGALARGLAELGVPVELAVRRSPAAAPPAAAPHASDPTDPPRVPGPVARACFRDPLPGELVVRGRKLAGSAQWREGGALLQHGSLLLHDDQRVVERLRAGGGDPEVGPVGIGLAELPAGPPPPETVREAIARGFAAEFGIPVESGEVTPAELGEACRLEARYRSPAWTWRR